MRIMEWRNPGRLTKAVLRIEKAENTYFWMQKLHPSTSWQSVLAEPSPGPAAFGHHGSRKKLQKRICAGLGEC